MGVYQNYLSSFVKENFIRIYLSLNKIHIWYTFSYKYWDFEEGKANKQATKANKGSK